MEENGVKFLRSKKESDNDTIKFNNHKCTDEEFWRDSFNYSFDFDTSQLTIEFKKSQPEQYAIDRFCQVNLGFVEITHSKSHR